MPTYSEPVLAMNEIQGNVLAGFNKPHQWLFGFSIGADGISGAKQWLREVLPVITPLSESTASRFKVRQSRIEFGRDPDDLRDRFVSVAFSYIGITKLTDDIDGFSQAFRDGQWRRAPSKLGDPVKEGRGAVSEWRVGRDDASTPDIFVICAADREMDLIELKGDLERRANTHGLTKIYEDEGHDLVPENGITGREHFGFKDLVSRIRVRGRKSHKKDDFYTPRDPKTPQDAVLPEFSSPGQVLIWPGQFVIGYERQSATDTRSPVAPIEPRPSWSRNGSYLVFRRLRQDVPAFRKFVHEVKDMLAKDSAFTGVTEEHVSAMLVGRWRNGTPLEVSPKSSMPSNPTNDFEYLRNGWPPGSSSQVDILGARCPISAHIRKVNPRDQGSDLGPPADNLRRSILRRGIPYGKALPSDNSDDADRGLLFLCYQASIEDTFETITQDWMNSTAGPTPPQSFDMLIGRNPNGGERFCFFGATRVATKELFVYPTGGGYFFTPAISGIRDVLSVD